VSRIADRQREPPHRPATRLWTAAALIQAKLTPAAAVMAMTTGRRYGGPEALTAGLVDLAVPEGEVLTQAIELVRPLAGKDPSTLGAIKATMYAAAITALLQPTDITVA
jgi:enoyl-CoA hydratase/carnithine racemase